MLKSMGYPSKRCKVTWDTEPTRQIIRLDFIENLKHRLPLYPSINVGVVLCDVCTRIIS